MPERPACAPSPAHDGPIDREPTNALELAPSRRGGRSTKVDKLVEWCGGRARDWVKKSTVDPGTGAKKFTGTKHMGPDVWAKSGPATMIRSEPMQVALRHGLTTPHLTSGARYTVLELYDDSARVIDDGGAPALYPMSLFLVVDEGTSSSWRTSTDADGVVSRAPEDFKSPGFFERVWDREPATIARFRAIADLDPETLERFENWVSKMQDDVS